MDIREYSNATQCGLAFSANVEAYRCRTCAISPTMALCSNCFQRGNHEGHDFNKYISQGSGFCDCGDKSFMKESGFCQRHGPQNQTNKREALADLLSTVEVLLPKLIQHLRNNNEPVRKHENATTCGFKWNANFTAYRCLTCARTSSMSLCPGCFQRGNHEGHNFYSFRSPTDGFCDCGDKSFLTESGFCQRHGPQNQTDKSEASRDILAEVEDLMPRLIQHLREKSGSDLDILCQNLKDLLLNGDDHDVTLQVKNRTFRAHRCILKARSDVLSSMLTHNMTEKNSGVINIPDCDPKAFEQFLLYLYSGKVGILDKSTMLGLYYIADKYNMANLKEECCAFIKKSLSSIVVCEVIQLALKHSDTGLLSFATEYFVENTSEIFKTVEWQSFLMEKATYANELLVKAANKWDKAKTGSA